MSENKLHWRNIHAALHLGHLLLPMIKRFRCVRSYGVEPNLYLLADDKVGRPFILAIYPMGSGNASEDIYLNPEGSAAIGVTGGISFG